MSDTTPAAAPRTTPPPTPAAAPPPRWLVLGLAALTIVAVGAGSLLLFRDDLIGDAADEVTYRPTRPTLADDFERPDADRLDDPDHPWAVARGAWAVRDGHAALTEPGPGGPRNLVVLPADRADGVARVTATAVEPGWAFAFRVRDEHNYWSLVARPETGSWSIEVVRDGVATEIEQFLAVAPADGDRIEVHLTGALIAVTVNGTTGNEVDDDDPARAGGVGLLSLTGDNVASMAWDDVELTGG